MPGKRLIELCIVLAAILVASLTAGKQGDNFGRNDAQRSGVGALAGSATAGLIVGAYRIFRTKE